MNVFDIIGPIMIGPSSSHTAGAVRLGYVAGKILGEPPVRAVIRLSGSFAQTCRGHGTDKALLAGILGFAPDDVRIRDSLSLAEREGKTLSQVILSDQAEQLEQTEQDLYEQMAALPSSLQETAQGGLAATPTGIRLKKEIFDGDQGE